MTCHPSLHDAEMECVTLDHLLEWPDEGPTAHGRGAASGAGVFELSGAGGGAVSDAGGAALLGAGGCAGSGAGGVAQSDAGGNTVSGAGALFQSGTRRIVVSVLERTRRHALRCSRPAVQTAIRVNRAAVARQLALARRSASGIDITPVLATLDVVAIEHIDGTPPVAQCWTRAAVDVATTLVGDEDTLGRICGDRWRNGRGEAGGRRRDREHLELALSSTSELHKEDRDGTWASCLIPQKIPRTERDASPSSLSGVNRSVVPQSSTAARSCSRGTDWHVDSGRLELAGPLSLLVGAVRLTRLPAVEQLPTFTFYVPVCQSWRRVEDVPSQSFVPHMGDRVGSCADAARAALQDRWAGRDDSDGSDQGLLNLLLFMESEYTPVALTCTQI